MQIYLISYFVRFLSWMIERVLITRGDNIMQNIIWIVL